MRRGGLADRRFHQSHFRGRSTARNLRAVDNGEYVDKMWIGEDEGSRTPGDTVERLLHLARELIALRCDVIFATRAVQEAAWRALNTPFAKDYSVVDGSPQ